MYDLAALKNDLLSLSPKDFYVKYILKSHNWYFSEYLKISEDEFVDKMDYFKELVSSNFNISFHSVQIVGSAKTGVSLSPYKILKPFHEENGEQEASDIDIAVVSAEIYMDVWRTLRSLKEVYLKEKYYSNLAKSIFRGYINEKDLTHFRKVRKIWVNKTNFLNKMLQDKLFFVHPITYRIYRCWEDLEDYQVCGISKAMKILRSGINV